VLVVELWKRDESSDAFCQKAAIFIRNPNPKEGREVVALEFTDILSTVSYKRDFFSFFFTALARVKQIVCVVMRQAPTSHWKARWTTDQRPVTKRNESSA
jgi:hypothetical protein